MTDLFSEVLRVRPGQAGSLLVGPDSGQGFLYGGLTMAVAIRAAAAAVEQPLVPMSMRTSFLSFGAWGSIQADVQAVHDSRSSRAPGPANGSCSTPSLFDAEPLARSGGRYVSRGTVHDRRGRLVASFVQEGLTRPMQH